MAEKTKTSETRLTAFFARHRYLVRLILIVFAGLFVITVSSTIAISNKSREQLAQVTRDSMTDVCQQLGDEMSSYIKAFQGIGDNFIVLPITYEKTIRDQMIENSNTRPNMEPLLQGYATSMPVLSSMNVYFHESNSVYSGNFFSVHNSMSSNARIFTCSWIDLDVFFHFGLPEVDRGEFAAFLTSVAEPCFYQNEILANEGRLLYLVPVCINTMSDSRRVLIFDMTGESLQRAFEHLLGERCTLSRISYQDVPIFDFPVGEDMQTFSWHGSDGFDVTISAPREKYMAVYNQFSAMADRLCVISIILCIALMTVFVIYSYRPINLFVRHTGNQPATDEITAVTGYIREKEENERDLRTMLENERENKRISQLEMLLLGIPSSQIKLTDDHDLLTDNKPFHFAAVSPLPAIPSINESVRALQKLENVTVIEQYRSDYLVSIVGADEETAAQETFAAAYRRIMGEDIPLGMGMCVDNISLLHQSYLEAILMLRRDQLQLDSKDDDSEEDQEFNQFAVFKSQLVANDQSCVQTAKKLFARLEHKSGSFQLYWHDNYKLIEKITDLLNSYGYQVEPDRISAIYAMHSIDQVQDSFLTMLDDMMKKGPQGESPSEKELSDSVLQFIDENLDNCLFGINDIVDLFNLTEYTVSQMIRKRCGKNFKKYLTELRLDKAKQLLASSSESILAIAQQCGFSSSSYFIRVFKSEEGVTPLQYRRNQQEDQ